MSTANQHNTWVIDPVAGKCARTGPQLTAGLTPNMALEVVNRFVIAKETKPGEITLTRDELELFLVKRTTFHTMTIDNILFDLFGPPASPEGSEVGK